MLQGRNGLDPVLPQVELDNGYGADKLPVDGAKGVRGIDFQALHKSEQNLGYLPSAPAAPQPLGKAGHVKRGSDLDCLIQGTDVNPQLQGHGSPGDNLLLRGFHLILRIFPKKRRYVPVMYPVDVRRLAAQRRLPQMGHHKLDLLPAVGKNNGLFVQGLFKKIVVMLPVPDVPAGAVIHHIHVAVAFHEILLVGIIHKPLDMKPDSLLPLVEQRRGAASSRPRI